MGVVRNCREGGSGMSAGMMEKGERDGGGLPNGFEFGLRGGSWKFFSAKQAGSQIVLGFLRLN